MTSKVLWGEGLLLRPQHFQRQDQYHEHCLHKGIRAVHPYAWGVDKLEVDRDALGNGVLRRTLGMKNGSTADRGLHVYPKAGAALLWKKLGRQIDGDVVKKRDFRIDAGSELGRVSIR